jgi:hypothetical protein
LIKGRIHQEGLTNVNIYAPNISIHSIIKETLLDMKGQVDHNTIIVDDFDKPLSPIDTLSRQKMNK